MRKLTDKQHRELRAQLKPVITDVLSDPTMQAHILNAYAHAPEGATHYERLAIEGSDRGQHGRTLRGSRDLSPGIRTFARIGLATALGQGDRSAMLDAAKTLDVHDELKKALEAGSTVGGGALLTDPTADEVIEVLRGMSIVRRAGPREIEIPAGTLRTPRIDVGVSSGYVGEGKAIPSSDVQTGSVSLVAKKLAALVILSNELSQFGNAGDIDAIVADDMFASISETEDVAFLTGTGTENEPLGIVNAVAAGQKFNANATVNVANTVDDLSKAMNLLLTAAVPMRSPAWLWAPRTSTFLRTLLNANGQFVFRDEIDRGRLFGWPFFESTHVPVDLGAGNDESLIVFADMSEIMVGDVRQVALDRSNQATVTINGVLTSLFETDRAAIRVRTWNDLQMRHDVGAAVIESVLWGA